MSRVDAPYPGLEEGAALAPDLALLALVPFAFDFEGGGPTVGGT